MTALRIGVTGASGFLGSHLVEHLARRDDLEIRALTRTIPATLESHPHVMWVQGDLTSPRDCAAFVEGLDTLAHLAHVNTPLTSNRELATDAASNLVPTLNLLGAIRTAGAVTHVVYTGSGGAVYRPNPDGGPLDESSVLEPLSSYGILKLTTEAYLRMAANEGWLTATSLRIGNAYGALLPPERLQGFIGVAMHELAAGRPIRIFGNPENVRDYLHLSDVIRVIELALEHRDGFSVYNVGSGVGTSVRELVALLARVTGIPATGRQDPAEAVEAAHLPSWVILDSTKARRELGWKPEVELEDGLTAMWNGRRI